MEKMETKSTGTIFFHGFTTIKGEKAPIDWDKERIKDYLIQKAKLDTTADWGNSLYLSENINVAMGYAKPDSCVGQDFGYIVVLKLNTYMPYIHSDSEAYANTIQNGDDAKMQMANAMSEAKKLICQTDGNCAKNFMDFLGENGYAYECFHDNEHRIEFIVPSNLINYFDVVGVFQVRNINMDIVFSNYKNF